VVGPAIILKNHKARQHSDNDVGVLPGLVA
jgi:hypothetical protein